LSLAQMQHGSLLCSAGETAAGIAEMESGLQLFRATGAVSPLPYYLCYLAEGYLNAGELDKGLEAVREGLHLTETIVDRNCTPELLRVQGELLSAQRAYEEADDCFRKAIQVAEADGAGLWKLRSSIPYARSCWRRGKGQQALGILAAACGAIRGNRAHILSIAQELQHTIEAGMARSTSMATGDA